MYWIIKDDLRFYICVQFYPIVLFPIILLCFKTPKSIAKRYWVLIIAYVIAKVLEHLDISIYNSIKFSGHSLKHLVSALGLYLLYLDYKKQINSNKPLQV